MKQTIITIACLLAFTGTKAQIEKGSSAIGINAGLGFYLNKDELQSGNTFRVTAQPVFEYFVANNLSLGAAINGGFQFENYENKYSASPSKSNYYTQTYGFAIQLKKYWFASSKVGFTLSPQLATNYYESNSSYSNLNSTNNYTYNYNYWYHSAMLNFGALYFIKPNVAIEAQTNFLNYSYFPGSPSSNNNDRHTFSALAFQSSLTVGIKYIPGNKKAASNP